MVRNATLLSDEASSSPSRSQAGRVAGYAVFVALAVYSAALFITELRTSQEYVRVFFTDIGHRYKPGYFAAAEGHIGYGMNTTLSAFLLVGASLLIFFACFAGRAAFDHRRRFLFAQGAFLLYVGLDDRFMLHERLGAALGTWSTVILASIFALNGLVYLAYFRVSYFSRDMAIAFFTAATLFGVMMSFDLVFPHDMPGRLSLEDLTKCWAGLFFLRFGWAAAESCCGLAPADRSEQWFPAALVRFIPERLKARVMS